MFLVNSRPGRFTAAPKDFGREGLHPSEHPFFRSYGATLPSSLTRVYPSTLGFSPHLPVSVCGTVTEPSHIEVFLGSTIRVSLSLTGPIRISGLRTDGFAYQSPLPA